MTDHRDLVIADLAASEAALLDQVVALQLEAATYREFLRITLGYLNIGLQGRTMRDRDWLRRTLDSFLRDFERVEETRCETEAV